MQKHTSEILLHLNLRFIEVFLGPFNMCTTNRTKLTRSNEVAYLHWSAKPEPTIQRK